MCVCEGRCGASCCGTGGGLDECCWGCRGDQPSRSCYCTADEEEEEDSDAEDEEESGSEEEEEEEPAQGRRRGPAQPPRKRAAPAQRERGRKAAVTQPASEEEESEDESDSDAAPARKRQRGVGGAPPKAVRTPKLPELVKPAARVSLSAGVVWLVAGGLVGGAAEPVAQEPVGGLASDALDAWRWHILFTDCLSAHSTPCSAGKRRAARCGARAVGQGRRADAAGCGGEG